MKATRERVSPLVGPDVAVANTVRTDKATKVRLIPSARWHTRPLPIHRFTRCFNCLAPFRGRPHTTTVMDSRARRMPALGFPKPRSSARAQCAGVRRIERATRGSSDSRGRPEPGRGPRRIAGRCRIFGIRRRGRGRRRRGRYSRPSESAARARADRSGLSAETGICIEIERDDETGPNPARSRSARAASRRRRN